MESIEQKYASVLSVRLVKESQLPLVSGSSPGEIVDFVSSIYEDSPVEKFSVVYLNSANKITGCSVVTSGILDMSVVHPREVFVGAILKNAKSIICVHNHPSGNLELSLEDKRVTKQLKEAGKIIGIQVLDHIIIGENKSYYSFASEGLM